MAVISNGTAILGLGDLGALASKPVMEGKAVLFKRFADVDAIDIEVDTKDVEQFINCVRYLGPTFGGINLEDIKAPDCFVIEERLRELMDIPVFHDDQHGTAIISAAGVINALHLTGRNLSDIKVVVNGAGSAGIACLELLKSMGLPSANAILCDTKGVIYRGRTEGMNQWKSAHAVETKDRTLEDALKGCDVFLGLSAKGAVTQDMVKTMAKAPIIFAMANPDPEITPEEVKAVRPDAIVATGRSDYPNQVNNVLGFPYIFRGALDVRARTINEEMKIAAVYALAELAREDVPDEVALAYRGARPVYGPEYIIPVPFDPRLIARVSSAVAEAAVKIRCCPARNEGCGCLPLSAVRPPRSQCAAVSEHHSERARQSQARRVRGRRGRIRYPGRGRRSRIPASARRSLWGAKRSSRNASRVRASTKMSLEIRVPASARQASPYIDLLYNRLQRRGALYRDCVRMVANDRNIYAACMVAAGRCRCDGHGRHAILFGRPQRCAHRARCAQGPAPHRRDPYLQQGQGRVRGRHQRPRNADRRRTCRYRHSGGRCGAPVRAHAARGAAGLDHLRLSPQRTQRAHHRSGEDISIRAVSISNMTAKSRSMWRSIRSAWRSIRSAG